MLEREIEQFGTFQIATARGNKVWWAWAKQGTIEGSDPATEPGMDVWCEFGTSRQEAADKLKCSLEMSRA